MKKQDIMAKIEKAIERCKKIKLELAHLPGHPQVKELCMRTEGKQEAFEAVLLAMLGNGIYLNIEAKGE